MGIGNGCSSGLESFNNKVLVYTGRRCPSSWGEVKTNISKNVRTCAKLCTAFLDSSLGMAVAMGVVGVATVSVCIGEDVAELAATALLPFVTPSLPPTALPVDDQKIFLCFKKSDHIKATGVSTFQAWKSDEYGKCFKASTKDTDDEVHCVKSSNYQSQFFQIPVPHCVGLVADEIGLLNKDERVSSDRYFGFVYLDWQDGLWVLSKAIECIMEDLFSMMEPQQATRSNQGKNTLCDRETKIRQYTDMYGRKKSIDVGAYCWPKTFNMSKTYPKFFIPMDKCIPAAPLTTLSPYTTPLTTSVTMLPPQDNACDTCSIMTLAFGIGSGIVLTATLAKVVYKQWKKSIRAIPKGSCNGLKKLTVLTLQEGLLLGASGLGSSTIMTSIMNSDPCSQLSDTRKVIIITSTALYGTSVISRLLGTCITSPLGIEKKAEEDNMVELSMLMSSTPTVTGPVKKRGNEEESTPIPTVVVLDSPKCSTCCCKSS
ncbi:hypothetical protein CLAVI_000960 [Candidatus Clavichlamydia salmonicola]|uniref:hypothetical protein n=1 Tax=Candidatus Clavichlamydia salmonicola TaxID=469812 RepID=UPI001891D7E9|nr:hypothetical protein [Candidatus Clavichlamydia salmonicola]MBF5051319.1 hypothetical protein [Candidatus Clavichlamydia salmonicola]